MIDPKKIQFASQYNIDKIVMLKTGVFDTAAQPSISFGIHTWTIPHKFGRPVFTDLLWDMGNGVTDGGNSVDSAGNCAISLSDKNNVYIYVQNIFGPVSGLLNYKLIGSWIDNYDDTNPAIDPDIDTTGSLYFDSRQNYQKVYKEEEITATPSFVTDTIVDHGLDYLPNYKVYFESFPGQVWPTIYGGVQDFWLFDIGTQNECPTFISSTQLTLQLQGGISAPNAKIWYRIYLDD